MFYLFLIFLALLIVVPTAIAGLIGAPLALTKKKQLKEIIEKAELKPSDTFYDLGSGTGRILVAVYKQSKAKVVGFELSPFYFLLGWLNLKINLVSKAKGKVCLKNFFQVDLSKPNAVFLFLMPKSLKKIVPKLKKELPRGAKIISYCFPLPSFKPFLTLNSPNLLPVYFYRM